MACYKPGKRSRLIYTIRENRGRKDEPKGFGWRDFRDLIVRARLQLGGPIVLVWDNVHLHLTAGMREFIDANAEWLNVFQLPPYAPDLNPQEGVWSVVRRDIGNLAAADLDQIARAVKRRLKQIQYRPHVVGGCLAGTGLGFGMDDLENHGQRPPRRPPRMSAPLEAISLLRLYRRRAPRTRLRRCSQSNACGDDRLGLCARSAAPGLPGLGHPRNTPSLRLPVRDPGRRRTVPPPPVLPRLPVPPGTPAAFRYSCWSGA
ncbi:MULTISPECIES: transposase [unclassified Streptomyces]|uniref:transposase n=1 Tax=unclassified Streptomyces TaxID=2593676 RepID=UPI001E53B696|nr:transposase [Streptomyces sp. CB02980]MCB8907673.1 transposase [Streptomyces sp. CB02980]